MGLSDLTFRRATLEIDNAEGGTTPLTLYGLGADAIAFLSQEHGPVIGALYHAAVSGEVNASNIGAVVTNLVNEAPLLVASVIAFGAREPEAMEAAAAMPLGVQIEAVEKIFWLTFTSEAQLKKVRGIVSGLLAGLMSALPAASTSGSQASGEASAS